MKTRVIDFWDLTASNSLRIVSLVSGSMTVSSAASAALAYKQPPKESARSDRRAFRPYRPREIPGDLDRASR